MNSRILLQIINSIIVGLKGVFIIKLMGPLGPAFYGGLTQYVMTSSIIGVILVLQLDAVIVRFFDKDAPSRNVAYFTNAVAVVIAIGILLGFAVFVWSDFFSSLIFGSISYRHHVRVLVWSGCVQGLLLLLLSSLQAKQSFTFYSVVQISQVLLQLLIVGFSILYIHELSHYEIFCFMLAGEVLLLITTGVLSKVKLDIRAINAKVIYSSLAFSCPLFLGAILYWSMTSSGHYVLASLGGLHSVGQYAATYSLSMLGGFLISPISVVAYPMLVSRLGDKLAFESMFLESLKKYIILSLPIMASLAVYGEAILKTFATKRFFAGKDVVILLLIGVFLWGLSRIIGLVLILNNKTMSSLCALAIGVISYFLVLFVFGANISPRVLACASVISFGIVCGFTIKFARKHLRGIGCRSEWRWCIKIIVSLAVQILFIYNFPVVDLLSLMFGGIFGLIIYFSCVLATGVWDWKHIRDGVLRMYQTVGGAIWQR